MDLQKINDLFTTNTGIDLVSKIDEMGNELMNEKRFIRNQHLLVTTFIKKWNYRFDYETLSDARKNTYNEILIEQMLYTLENGDLTTWNGVDLSTGQVLEEQKITDRFISPLVRDLLITNGFLTRAIL